MKRTTAIKGFRRALAECRDAVDKNWDGALAGDEDAIHDLRIALRRSRAILGVAKRVIDDADRDRFNDELRWLATSTSDARDLDVMLGCWKKLVGALPSVTQCALEPVRDQVRERRLKAHDAMRATLTSDRSHKLLTGWSEWLNSPMAATERDARRKLRPVVKHRVKRALRRVAKHEADGIEPHELRKEIKQVRYVVESFGPVFNAKRRKKRLSRLRRWQNKLGRAQDVVVQMALIESIAAETDFAPETVAATCELRARVVLR